MQPTLGKRAFIPARFLNSEIGESSPSLHFEELKTQRIAAILANQDFDDDEVDEHNDDAPTVVKINEYVRVKGGASVPRSWALQFNLPWEDRTVNAIVPRLVDGPKPRDDAQKAFFGKLFEEALKPGPQDILANADTGAGKSVAGIWLAQMLSQRTIIVVDSNKIAQGWLNNLRKFYGHKWVSKNVGRVQQYSCEYEGKRISIALAQSLARRNYGHDFYRAFGLAIFDEVQIFGSPHYSKILGMFYARVRVGFTAENRTGSFGKLIKAHLGDTRVTSKQKVMRASAYLIRNKITETFYCQSDGAIITGLSRIRDRNAKLANLIKTRGYDRGRQVLVLSDRTAHLVHLRDLCAKLGVPRAAMGLHMGQYLSGRFVVQYSYGRTNQRLFVAENRNEAQRAVSRLRRGDYAGFDLPKALYNRLQHGESVIWKIDRENYSPSQNELDNITNSCQIIFATYQIFSKGVDVPRLDMGVEALPSGNLKQPLGRILRLHEGKPTPEWYAICDRIEADFETPGSLSAAALINLYLVGKTRTRIAALKRAKAKLIYA